MAENRKWQALKLKLVTWHRQMIQASRFQSRVRLHTKWYICFVLALITCSNSAVSKGLTDYPNQLTRDGELVVLPNHGTVYVATDFHAHWADFNQWLKRTRLIERLEAGEDVYGLILGDVVDHKPGDRVIEPFGDVKIVDRIMQIQAKLGVECGRLIHLTGNHEFAVADTYRMLTKSGMTLGNRQRVIDQLYRTLQGVYYQQFNFIERMSAEHYEYLTRLPTVAIGRNGFVGTHAGVSSSTRNLGDLIDPSPKILEELLWSRPAVATAGGYTPLQTATFLREIGGSILVVGHTPLSNLPVNSVKNGVARLESHQLVFSTGYGALPGAQSYLSIDLSKRYESVFQLRYEMEIHPLYPKRKE